LVPSIGNRRAGCYIYVTMDSFRHQSTAKSAVLGAIVLFAFLLQAFVAAAAPVAAFDSPAHVTCSENGSQHEMPGNERGHCHGLCCILECAACSPASVTIASGAAIFPARMALAIVWSLAPAAAIYFPLKFYFGARGPPRTC